MHHRHGAARVLRRGPRPASEYGRRPDGGPRTRRRKARPRERDRPCAPPETEAGCILLNGSSEQPSLRIELRRTEIARLKSSSTAAMATTMTRAVHRVVKD